MFSLLQPYGGVAGFFRKTMDDETGETDNAFGNGQDGGSYYRKSRLKAHGFNRGMKDGIAR
ncbi:hypothetical protein C1N76_15645 [Geobacillus thermoleovorans]|uniref:Uncharacterized protein n=1 Tax=Geobacillus thermoleovorans TaxID=33941 RepID=A0A2Z3NA57_GEOTH|nr:hypothetical protein C1N76_15645 [Geobacillus thermoleovorans]